MTVEQLLKKRSAAHLNNSQGIDRRRNLIVKFSLFEDGDWLIHLLRNQARRRVIDLIVASADARIEPYFPFSHGVPRVDDWRVISGILFVIRNGLQLRDAPEEYGLHKTICNALSVGTGLGVSNRIFAELAAKAGKPTQLMITPPI
ncbi:transposase [Mesorhizobium sp. AR07]|uniref:transposase n=1 Tax=Mesorhizobium sp. AR07 TaxID=2865838 RepID=UPI0022018535|nr:transposase [Mesorhizobium sp. AR07]